MKCSVCGKSEPKGSQFCGSCGAQFAASIPGLEKAIEKSIEKHLAREPGTTLDGRIETIEELPMVGFLEAVRRGFKNYINFHGRATRAEYWWWALFTLVVSVILSIVDMRIGTYNEAANRGLISGLFSLAIIIPGLALYARRLHDIDKSGWWQLLGLGFWLLIPLLFLLWWTVKRGDAYPNKHGPDPRQATSQ